MPEGRKSRINRPEPRRNRQKKAPKCRSTRLCTQISQNLPVDGGVQIYPPTKHLWYYRRSVQSEL